MKYRRLLAFLVAFALPVAAQTLPGDVKPISRNLNRWVTFQLGPAEKHYALFFLYLDEDGWFSVYDSGRFRVREEGRCEHVPFTPGKDAPRTLRLAHNEQMIILSDKCRKELGAPDRPDWLKKFDDGTNTVKHRTQLGASLNLLRDYEAALEPLESAYKEDPGAEDVAQELAFACNMLERYDRAVAVASEAWKRKPAVEVGNELGYAYLGAHKDAEAIDVYLSAINLCTDKQRRLKSLMASNVALAYAERGDDVNAAKWRANAKAWE